MSVAARLAILQIVVLGGTGTEDVPDSGLRFTTRIILRTTHEATTRLPSHSATFTIK